MTLIYIIVAGFALDLIFGDPRDIPHPICLIGKVISALELFVRKYFPDSRAGLLCGGIFIVIVVCLFSFLLPAVILLICLKISPWLFIAVEAFMCFQIFAAKSLKDAALLVYEGLKSDDIKEAREKVGWIVGRETAALTGDECAKAAIETVAENTSDGIIAPMLYMFIGGAPLAFLYKGINTMDSMIGYKNEKYLYLGRCAAKLDDVANFIPARISGLIMIAASFFAGLDWRQALFTFKRDRYNHLSPNSAMTESAAAGALHLQLGGDHYYFGELVHKDTIGDDLKKVEPEDICRMNRLMYMTAILALLLFCLLRAISLLYLNLQ